MAGLARAAVFLALLAAVAETSSQLDAQEDPGKEPQPPAVIPDVPQPPLKTMRGGIVPVPKLPCPEGYMRDAKGVCRRVFGGSKHPSKGRRS